MTNKLQQALSLEGFEKTKFAKEGGSCFECCDYETMYAELKQCILTRDKKILEAVGEEINESMTAYHLVYDNNQEDEKKSAQIRDLVLEIITKALEI